MRFLKISLAILSIGLFISLFASSSVSAQSAYDDVIITADKPQLLDKDGNIIDVSTTWFNIMQGNEQVIESLNLNPYWSANTFCEFVPNENASWALSQMYNVSGQPSELRLFWINDKSYNLEFHTDDGDKGLIVSPGEIYNTCTIRTNISGTTRVSKLDDNVSRVSSIGSRGQSIAFNYSNIYHSSHPVFINWGIDYPPDYQGEIPPVNIDFPQPTIISLNYDISITPEGDFTIMRNTWFALGGGFGTTDLQGVSKYRRCELSNQNQTVCPEDPQTTSDWNSKHPANVFLTGKLYSSGYYGFEVKNDEVVVPVPPFPDDLAPYDVIDRFVLFYWDGFSAVTINTLGANEETVVIPQDLENNNLANKYFDMLDIPSFGLVDVVTLPLTYISSLPEATCSTISLPLPNNIGNLTLPCMTEQVYEPKFPTILMIYQTILTGLFSYYLAVRMFGNIKELSSPRDDGIEVARL